MSNPNVGGPTAAVSFVTHETGAKRSPDADHLRFDLITPIGLRRLAETYHEGALKYGENNWQKGFKVSGLLNHTLNHIFLFLNGDESEDHLAHAAWNLFTSIHFQETRPDMMDVPFKPGDSPDEKLREQLLQVEALWREQNRHINNSGHNFSVQEFSDKVRQIFYPEPQGTTE